MSYRFVDEEYEDDIEDDTISFRGRGEHSAVAVPGTINCGRPGRRG